MNFQNILICGLVLMTLASCNQGGSKKSAGAIAADDVTAQPLPEEYTRLDDSEITTECGVDEKVKLKAFENLLSTSKEEIKLGKSVATSINAIKVCDALLEHLGDVGACRVVKRNPIKPNAPAEITYYDQFRVNEKCQDTEDYLISKNALPEKDVTPVPTPNPTRPPVVVKPPTTTTPPVQSGTSRQCTKEEFTRLNNTFVLVTAANAKIPADLSNWKYDPAAVSAASDAKVACEALMAIHDQQPCEKTVDSVLKKYNSVTLRERCEKARTYFYEFTQNKLNLQHAKADLFLDISSFPEKTFEADYINDVQGCRVENKSGGAIDYRGQQSVLIKDSRGFKEKMMVLETTEGLLVQCYGLNIGEAFSKREIVRVLKEEGTNMPLVYRLK